jgi:hypothetical protein
MQNPISRSGANLILGVLVSSLFALWFLVVLSGNTVAAWLMHYNHYLLGWHYQVVTEVAPKVLAPITVNSFYLISCSFLAKIFGTTFFVWLLPNLVAYALLTFLAFRIGRGLTGGQGGYACALVMAALPPIAGLSKGNESSVLEMFFLLFMVWMFLKWAQKKGGVQFLFLAVTGGCFAVASGLTATFQSAVLIHIGAFLFAFSLECSVRNYRRKKSMADFWRPWVGAFFIGLAAASTLFWVTQKGAALAYQFQEFGRYTTDSPLKWWDGLIFYPVVLAYDYVVFPVLGAAALLGLIAKKQKQEYTVALLLCLVIPIAIFSPVQKLDSAYLLSTAPFLALLIGLKAEQLFMRRGYWSLAGIVLLFLTVAGVFLASFLPNTKVNPLHGTRLMNQPTYLFLQGRTWDDEVTHMDRQADALAQVADQIAGPNNFCLPAIMPIEKPRTFQYRARLVNARPYTFPFFVTDAFNDVDCFEPKLSDYCFFAIRLDPEIAGLSLRDRLKQMQGRIDMELPRNRYQEMLNQIDRFEYYGQTAGVAIYTLKRTFVQKQVPPAL